MGPRQEHLYFVPLKIFQAQEAALEGTVAWEWRGGRELGQVKKTQMCVCVCGEERGSEECGIKEGQEIL